jgi:hypothetical protein
LRSASCHPRAARGRAPTRAGGPRTDEFSRVSCSIAIR